MIYIFIRCQNFAILFNSKIFPRDSRDLAKDFSSFSVLVGVEVSRPAKLCCSAKASQPYVELSCFSIRLNFFSLFCRSNFRWNSLRSPFCGPLAFLVNPCSSNGKRQGTPLTLLLSPQPLLTIFIEICRNIFTWFRNH